MTDMTADAIVERACRGWHRPRPTGQVDVEPPKSADQARSVGGFRPSQTMPGRSGQCRGRFRLLAKRAALAAAGGLLLCAQPALARDVNIAPAVCQVPFASQARGLRWSENFLMNPSWNVDTWVICPVTFDHAALPDLFVAAVSGSLMDGASASSPSCFLTMNGAENTDQPPYRTGNNRTLTWTLDYRFRPDTQVWTSTRQINKTLIPGRIGNGQLWAASFFCRLPTGYSISQLRLSSGSNIGGGF